MSITPDMSPEFMPRRPPTEEAPTTPPPVHVRLGEVASAAELFRLLGARRRLRELPRGDGAPVLDIPGFRAPEASMLPLRRFLGQLGYDARGWGLGVNRSEPLDSVARVAPTLLAWAEEAGRPVHLVGWSLGGVVARELARTYPGAVASVVSFGSPIVGGPIHTVAARRFDAEARERILADIQAANRTRIQVPLTVIFSRRDGIVNWRACLDRIEPRAHHVEVRSTHFGMGLDPDVWSTVALALRQAEALAA